MKRKILIGALALGAILGFGSGAFSLARHAAHHGHGCDNRQEARWDGWRGRHGPHDRYDRGAEGEAAAYRARIERLERHVADLEAAMGARPAVPPSQP